MERAESNIAMGQRDLEPQSDGSAVWFEKAAKIANDVGARCVTFHGDIEGWPTLEELETFMGARGVAVER